MVGVAVVSGGSGADPRTPTALPGLPAPFLGTAVVGNGGLTAAIDAYGAVVDLRSGPAGRPLIDNPAERQAAETVPADTGIVPRVRVGDGATLPFWRAESVQQRYLPGTNVVRTVARFGAVEAELLYAAHGGVLACLTRVDGAGEVSLADEAAARSRLRCDDQIARSIFHRATAADRHWLGHARSLGSASPAWAIRLYRRSLLVLRALTDQRSGAVAAGARDGWAYVWPRDAGAVALAFAAAGYRSEARRVAKFLLGLDLDAAARFHGDGTPLPGRAAQGDAAGWTAVAARAGGLLAADGPISAPYQRKSAHRRGVLGWRDRTDYWEGEPGDYLGNALTAEADPEAFETNAGLVRRAGDPDSGLDSAAAWAVRPFSQPALYPVARRTLLRLASTGTRYGITPGEAWGGVDPWSAPTAWTAWSLAALSTEARRANPVELGERDRSPAASRDRRAALRLLAALRRSATPAGALPERVDVRTGVPRSTTPLAWSHAFAVLALRELWP